MAVWEDGLILKAVQFGDPPNGGAWIGRTTPVEATAFADRLNELAPFVSGGLFSVPDADYSTFVFRGDGRTQIAVWDEKVWPGWGATATNPPGFLDFARDWTEAKIRLAYLAGFAETELEGPELPGELTKRTGCRTVDDLLTREWVPQGAQKYR
jgi:hypothetical protein